MEESYKYDTHPAMDLLLLHVLQIMTSLGEQNVQNSNLAPQYFFLSSHDIIMVSNLHDASGVPEAYKILHGHFYRILPNTADRL